MASRSGDGKRRLVRHEVHLDLDVVEQLIVMQNLIGVRKVGWVQVFDSSTVNETPMAGSSR